jgi:hypothetical protein
MAALETSELRRLAMEHIGLSFEQAVEYVMEREYNGLSHEQALAETMRKVGK